MLEPDEDTLEDDETVDWKEAFDDADEIEDCVVDDVLLVVVNVVDIVVVVVVVVVQAFASYVGSIGISQDPVKFFRSFTVIDTFLRQQSTLSSFNEIHF